MRSLLRVTTLAVLLSSPTSIAAPQRNTQPTVNLGLTAPNFPRPLVAKQVPVTLYVVYDPATVASEGTTPTSYPVKYTGLDGFVTRDIKGALTPYFTSVEVVAPGFSPTAASYVTAIVRVDSLTYVTEKISGAGGTAQLSWAELNWACALQVANADDFVLSLAGKARGSKPFATTPELGAAFRSALDQGIADLLKAYADGQVQQKLLAQFSPPVP